MIGIVFATHSEAQAFFNRVQARPIGEKPFPAYEFQLPDRPEKIIAVISGIGKVTAALATQHLITTHRADHIINAGVCGAVADDIAPGEVFCVTHSMEGDVLIRNATTVTYPSDCLGFEDLPAARLITGDKPICNLEKRSRCAELGELVDMEGAAVAKTCNLAGIRVNLIKVVSDFADESTEVDIKQNLPEACARLSGVLFTGIEKLIPRAAQSDPLPSKVGTLKKLLRFVKVEHTLFSLPLLFAGAWIGAGYRVAPLDTLLLVLLAGTGARTLGMAMNRILDRKLDAKNPRTANRELPAGNLSLPKAFFVAMTGLMIYLSACILIGKTCTLLAPIPAVALVSYSLLKRLTYLCHFGIGLVMALAPVGAFVAIGDGEAFKLDLNLEIVLLAGFTFCWMSGFDIIYALQDIVSDRQNNVQSLPARFGSGRAQHVAAWIHIAGMFFLAAFILVAPAGKTAWFMLMTCTSATALAYVPWIPLPVRFFPISAVSGIAGALVVLVKDLT